MLPFWSRRWGGDKMESALLRALRPGSRTVLCHPESSEDAVDLARRGFRLMIVHEEDSFLKAVRQELRAGGLASLLMGSAQSAVDQVPSLAKGFYELVLLGSRSRLSIGQMVFALGVGGLLVKPSDQGEEDLAGLQPVKLPAGYVGGRVGP